MKGDAPKDTGPLRSRSLQNGFLSSFCKTSKRAVFFLFIVAFAARLTILALFDHNRIPADGTGYHRLAVNLTRGHGLSLQESEPFERSFFREPGYPTFLAGIYSIVDLFHPVQYIQYYDAKTCALDRYYPEIVAAKLVQALMDSLGIVLIFMVLATIAEAKIAFLTGLAAALFFNLAFHSVYILRESLVMFLLLLLNLFYVRYLVDAKKTLWLLLMGLAIGLLILTFQIHFVIIPVLFILIWVRSRKMWQSVCHTLLVALVAGSITIPHCICAYQFYPDVRVFKTFGTSLTHEQNAYTAAIFRAHYYGVLTLEEAYGLAEWNRSSREQFEKSFNGYYVAKTVALNAMTPEGWISKRKISNYLGNAAKSLCLTKIGYSSGRYLLTTYGWFVVASVMLLPVLIGLFGLLGIIVCGCQKLIWLLPFVTYSLLFWALGDEYRRMIILQPYLVFFGLLFVNKMRSCRCFASPWAHIRTKSTCSENVCV